MSVNKYKPHVWVIPEDDANRQIIDGFLLHDAVAHRAVGVRGPAGGWAKVLSVFVEEYLPLLAGSPNCHVVMIVDFDETEDRRDHFGKSIPVEVGSRVFVIGSKDNPEKLKHELKMTFEEIGKALAEGCFQRELSLWDHLHLIHNKAELQRLVDVVRPILFQ
jgi:hypothetical protein